MSLLVFEHHPDETSGRLGEICRAFGHRLDVRRMYQGDAAPNDLNGVDGVISMGGPMNVSDADQHAWMKPQMALLRAAHDQGSPVVGVCLGAQMIAAALGGEVGAMSQTEVGWRPVTQAFAGTIDPLLAGVPWRSMQFHSHGCEVTAPPPASALLMSSDACRQQAFRVGLTTYGFQFHFEWTADRLRKVAAGDFAKQSDNGQIIADLPRHYDDYRRLGDRLCSQIAELLFPIDKR